MSQGDGKIHLRVEAPNGVKIEVNAAAPDLQIALQHALEFANGMKVSAAPMPAPKVEAASGENGSLGVAREKRPKSSKSTSSGGRPGRIGSFQPQKDLLDEAQQLEIRKFREEKSPSDQSDEVLVAMHKGEELLGKQGLSYNEIYTLMWRAGLADLPKALDVVLQKQMQDQLVERGPEGYFLKFLGRNRVERDLPSAG